MPSISKKTRTKITLDKTTRTSKKTKAARSKVSSRRSDGKGPTNGPSTQHHKKAPAETYVFECTRPGCGYKIWHDEKHEPGQVRFDMKCPKCHNHQFRCLGKGDVPGTFELPVPMEALDLNNISPTELGSSSS